MQTRIQLGIAALFLGLANTFPAVTAPTDASRFQWNVETTVGDYERANHHKPKWDADAKKALRLFAALLSGGANDSRLPELRALTRAALDSGCDDPLVRYLGFRHEVFETMDPGLVAQGLAGAADGMAAGGYSPIRVFFASDRAAEQLARRQGAHSPFVRKYRLRAAQALGETLDNPKTPFVEAYKACHLIMTEVESSPQDLPAVWARIEKPLFDHWPNQALSYSLKGEYWINTGWMARGSGYANTVSDAGWKALQEDLTVAQDALQKGFSLEADDATIPIQMITVAMGLGLERGEMEKWFKRAMAADTNCDLACWGKLEYLKPKWFGSREEMVSFGRECVASRWGGRVPLILLDAHRDIASQIGDTNLVAAYWHDATVWNDLHRSFEKFFALNPDEVGWHHDYAKAAYNAGQWQLFLAQCELMKDVNYPFFGGQDNFLRIKAEARRRLNGTPPEKPLPKN